MQKCTYDLCNSQTYQPTIMFLRFHSLPHKQLLALKGLWYSLINWNFLAIKERLDFSSSFLGQWHCPMFGYSFLLKLTESETTELQTIFPFGDISHERWRENKRRGRGGGVVEGMGFPLPLAASCLLACSRAACSACPLGWRACSQAMKIKSTITLWHLVITDNLKIRTVPKSLPTKYTDVWTIVNLKGQWLMVTRFSIVQYPSCILISI